jgi:hypothetical protein
MKWSGRLKEYASECSQQMVWWVKQAEAEKRIAELEAKNRELAADRATLYVENKALREIAKAVVDDWLDTPAGSDVCPVKMLALQTALQGQGEGK